MHFNSQVVFFDLAGIPIIGSLNNGFTVGLTAKGAKLCNDLNSGNISIEEARATDSLLLDCLIENGFFEEKPEALHLKLAYLHVTQRCNLNCMGCYSLDDSRNAMSDASTAQMKHAIDELATIGCESLFISGGEPFLRADLPELISHTKEAGIGKITLITNGTCVSNTALEEMAPFVDVIAVSFDGYDAKSPAHIRGRQRFDELTDAVQRIKNAGIQAHITPTIHAKNVGDLQHYVSLAQALGATMNYSLLSCEHNDDELTLLIPDEEELKLLGSSLLALGDSISLSGAPLGVNLNVSRSCGAGVSEVSIGADGTIYPCHMLHRREWALGNVFEEPLSGLLQGERVCELKDLDVRSFGECKNCPHMYLCGGGCRARSLYRYGDLHHPDPYCTMMKTYYDQLGRILVSSSSPA